MDLSALLRATILPPIVNFDLTDLDAIAVINDIDDDRFTACFANMDLCFQRLLPTHGCSGSDTRKPLPIHPN